MTNCVNCGAPTTRLLLCPYCGTYASDRQHVGRIDIVVDQERDPVLTLYNGRVEALATAMLYGTDTSAIVAELSMLTAVTP